MFDIWNERKNIFHKNGGKLEKNLKIKYCLDNEVTKMAYTIKEVSEIMNLPISTIRYYDKEGLLPYIERKESGYRLFHESDVKMLQVIECFKRTGMPIKEIKQFIEYVKLGDDSLEERYLMFKEREAAVKQQMADLEKQMEIIQHKLWYYQTAMEAGTEDIHKDNNYSCEH